MGEPHGSDSPIAWYWTTFYWTTYYWATSYWTTTFRFSVLLAVPAVMVTGTE